MFIACTVEKGLFQAKYPGFHLDTTPPASPNEVLTRFPLNEKNQKRMRERKVGSHILHIALCINLNQYNNYVHPLGNQNLMLIQTFKCTTTLIYLYMKGSIALNTKSILWMKRVNNRL